MRRIGIVDADLIARDNHRFPNLACLKLAGYWRDNSADVYLLSDYDWRAGDFDTVYVSKVFTDTSVPDWVLQDDGIQKGGTGFFFDKAPNLPAEVEHHMPDYHLYDAWIDRQVELEREKKARLGKLFDESSFRRRYREYTDYSIGFLTRGCFRKCGFCVNKKYDHVFEHSALAEFYDPSRKSICLLDDNFLGCKNWKLMLEELIATGKRFKFKQGLDERVLTDEKCRILFSSRYDGDFTFAFDNISDYDLIRSKLEMIRRHTDARNIKFYVLVGYDSTDANDIVNAFKRIELLMQYKCMPYIMRYQNQYGAPWQQSEYRGMYIQLARWCNQPTMFRKTSFREFCTYFQDHAKTDRICAAYRAMQDFEAKHPEIAAKYYDMKMFCGDI